MNPTIQSGMHPDAESLTAFAEQLLPEAEREQVLAHMATCSRCREVVFLAQRAESEEPATPAVTAAAPDKPGASWFSGWRWAWVPVAALAGFIGIAVLHQFRHVEPEPQMTAKVSQTNALSNAESAKPGPANNQPATPPKAELQKAKPAESPRARDSSLPSLPLANKDQAKQLDQKKSIEEKELLAGSASPTALSPGISNGPIHGMIAGAKASPYGGPMAANQYQQNQFQQNLEQQNLDQQNLVRQNSAKRKSQSLAADAANNLAATSPPPASAAKTVTVQAETVELAPTPPPASPPQIAPIPLDGKDHAALSAVSTQQSEVQKITLPNGLGVLSVASGIGRSVALDTAGGMFLSEDNGKHWQSIQTQWTGRATLVRTRPAGTQNGALRTPQTIRFELVNDKLQTWVSYDGKTWTLQPLPLK